jgi:Bacteriophage Sf6, terminase small subunit-like
MTLRARMGEKAEENMSPKLTKKKLRVIAQTEFQREQTNVLAVVDPSREIEELPEGLETGHVKRRKRGARSDRDCIDEICELIVNGITAKAACEYVGVPWATWQRWRRNDVENAGKKSDVAYECQLENMSDDIIEIFEQFKIKRDSAVKAYRKARKAWQKWEPTEQQKKRPPAPIYSGPSELDFRLARQRVKTRQWQFEQRQQMVGKTKSRVARDDGSKS